MILQLDKRFKLYPFADYGCHVMSECFVINRIGNISLDPSIIEDMVTVLSKLQAPNGKPSIDPADLTVNDPDAIVRYFGLSATTWARMEVPGYTCKPGEEELLQFSKPGYLHWVAGDGNGHVTYDPLGYSHTVADGMLIAKKIFSITRGV